MFDILLIEDDPAIRKLISDMLKGKDFRLHVAAGYSDARELIASNQRFDAALVDFWLDGDDALHLLDNLRSSLPETPVVLISGGAGKDGISLERTAAIAEISGAVRFLQKPFRSADLIEVIESVLKT